MLKAQSPLGGLWMREWEAGPYQRVWLLFVWRVSDVRATCEVHTG